MIELHDEEMCREDKGAVGLTGTKQNRYMWRYNVRLMQYETPRRYRIVSPRLNRIRTDEFVPA